MAYNDSLEALFDPDSIAFIGASPDSNRFLSFHRNIREWDSDRALYFINPNRDIVLGEDCYDSVHDVPVEIDLAILIVPASIAITTFRECGEAGVRSAIVIGAGFGEAGAEGQERKKELVRLSEKYDLPFCGPNTYGVISAQDNNIAAQVSTTQFDRGNVGAVLQSGGLVNQLLYSGIDRGFGFSKVVDSGNEASIPASEYFEYMISDDDTEVILGIIEGFSAPERFLEVSQKAHEEDISLVILKLARSDKGRQIAQSHTGSVTSSDEVVGSMFRQFGVLQVDSLDMLIETAALLSEVQDIPGNGIGVIEISGGGCTLFSDAVEETELELPELSQKAAQSIREHLPDIGRAENPIDMAMGWGWEGMEVAHRQALETLATEPDINIVVSRLSIPQEGEIGSIRDRLEEIELANKSRTEVFTVISRTSSRFSDDWRSAIKDSTVPFLQEYHKGIRTLAGAAWLSGYRREQKEPRLSPKSSAERKNISAGLTEHDAKQVLKDFGISTVNEELVETENEAIAAATKMGFPVCLKIASPSIHHKSDIGGVCTDITNQEELRLEFNQMDNMMRESGYADEISGFLVQEMISDGREILVGSKNTNFGQAVIVGLGGVFTEILDETVVRIAPFSETIAHDMLRDLRGYDVLTGARDTEPIMMDELRNLISQFSIFVHQHDEIVESDLNPVIATASGVYVVDALFSVEEKLQ